MISYPKSWDHVSDSPAKAEGQAVVELTFAFILFFIMFMAVVEFSHLLYTKVTLQHAYAQQADIW